MSAISLTSCSQSLFEAPPPTATARITVAPETIAEAVAWVIQQPDQVHIPDVPVYNFRNPFEGKSSPFAD